MKPSATRVSAADEQLDRVRVEGAVVADHLELDPVGLERLAGEVGGADRVAGGEAAGGVRQGEEAELVDHVEHRALGVGVDAAQGDGHDLGARGAQRLLHLLERAEAAGPGDQPRGPLAAAQLPGFGATLDRRQHLDPAALGERRRGPLAARDDLAVERDREAAGPLLGLGPQLGADRVEQRGPVGQLAALPVELDPHAATIRGERLDDAVGRQRRQQDPVAVVAGGEDQAVERAGADQRQVVRRSRAQRRHRLDQLHLGDLGQQPVGLAQQLVDAARGDRGVEAALLDRRADDQAAVRARHHVDPLGGDDPPAGRRPRPAPGAARGSGP